MNEQIKITVYRNFDNRNEGLSDKSPRAIELHNRRSDCLHKMLDENSYWKVIDWGKTDDEEAHEVVEAVLELLSDPTVIEGAKYLGNLLLTAGISAGTVEGVKWLFARIKPQQKDRHITNVFIRVAPGTDIQIDPPDGGGRVYFTQRLNDVGDRSEKEHSAT